MVYNAGQPPQHASVLVIFTTGGSSGSATEGMLVGGGKSTQARDIEMARELAKQL